MLPPATPHGFVPQTVEPDGVITDATQAIAVTVDFYDGRGTTMKLRAHAIAWTRTGVLVVWRDRENVFWSWVSAKTVNRVPAPS